jgi:NAD(P)-dependent dehydrogenase (short-subunit alcohol dehydrogenase family)
MGKTAVITGAASGMGFRTTERLLEQGWDVWALDLSEEKLLALEDKLGSRFHWCACDVADADSVQRAFGTVGLECDGIDALVCCAGVTITGSLEELTTAEADLMMDVNFKGPWLTTRAALPLLRARADVENPTRVVIIGSVGGIRPKVGNGFYSATKAAVHVLAGIFAVEHGPEGITTNAIAPSSTATPMSEAAEAQARRGFKLSGPSPLGRIGRPDDIADTVLYFLSDAAKYVNGVVLPVDGGTRAAYKA